MKFMNTKNIMILLIFLFLFSKDTLSEQEWDIHGCHLYLPDDAPQHRVIEFFKLPEVDKNFGIKKGLWDDQCYNMENPIKFIGYTAKNRPAMPKLGKEVTVQCKTISYYRLKNQDSSTLEYAQGCSDCITYFHLKGGYVVERSMGVYGSSNTYTISGIDDYEITASGTYPWYLDNEEMTEIAKKDKKYCYLGCVRKKTVSVNRHTLEIKTNSLDADGKTIFINNYSCSISNKKI